METKNSFSRFLTLLCVYFTAFSIAILLIELLIKGDFDNTNIDVGRFLLLLPYSVCLAFGNFLLKTPFLHKAVRVLCHCLLVVLSSFLFLYLPLGGTAEKNLYFILAVLLGYAIVYAICFLVRRKKEKSKKSIIVNKKN